MVQYVQKQSGVRSASRRLPRGGREVDDCPAAIEFQENYYESHLSGGMVY
jgi:hypothetical protein